MPRQKLPEGWEHKTAGAYSAKQSDCLVYIATDQELCIESERNDDVEFCPASVALAVIRNAGLDPLLDMAKRVVAEPIVTIEERLSELARLIKSMEEP